MSTTAPTTARPARSTLAGRARKAGLGLVMLGAMSVSISGQVHAVEPLLGRGMASVLAVTNDLAALLALNEIVGSGDRQLRRWAWAVLFLAGGTGAGLNTWHAIGGPGPHPLPVVWGALVGAGPVVLAGLLSHLVALSLSPDPGTEVPADQLPETSAGTGTVAEPLAERAKERATGQVTGLLTGTGAEAEGRTADVAQIADSRHGRVLELLPSPSSTAPEVSEALVQDRPDKEAQVRQVLALLADRPQLSGAAVARELGVSERTGRRVLRDAEQRQQQHGADQFDADLTGPPGVPGLWVGSASDRVGEGNG